MQISPTQKANQGLSLDWLISAIYSTVTLGSAGQGHLTAFTVP